jgi:hypothetical protein
MAGRQRDDLSTPGGVKRTSTDEQRTSAGLEDRCEGGIDFVFGSGVHDQDLPPERARRRFQVPILGVRIHQRSDDSSLGNQLMQQFQAPWVQRAGGKAYASNVAARPVDAGDEAGFDRIGAADKNDR